MNQDKNQAQSGDKKTHPVAPEKRPNETGSISVEGFVRIFDPNTKEKFVEKRA
jgi:hypothetical protein